MAQAVERRRTEQLVWEGVPPFAEVQVAGDHGGGPLVTFRNQVMEVFIMGSTQGLQAKVVDDQ